MGVWAWEAPTTQDTEVGGLTCVSSQSAASDALANKKPRVTSSEPPGPIGASYQEDNMASGGGYGYGGDGGYDTAYDDEYPAAKPYPHPGMVTVRQLVRVNQYLESSLIWCVIV